MLDISITEKRYASRTILRNVRLQIAPGEIVSLIGASGCGKSSLLSIAAGLDRQFTGSIRLDGQVLNGPSSDIGFIFQEPRLFPWLTVAQNVAFGIDPDIDKHTEISTLLHEVGIAAQANALPKQLSGGQAQRAAIARGLFSQPRVLLLDEPFSAVDAFTRIKLQDLLLRVAQQHRLTILLVTHDIDEALYLSDRVILLNSAREQQSAEFSLQRSPARPRNDIALADVKRAILDSLLSSMEEAS